MKIKTKNLWKLAVLVLLSIGGGAFFLFNNISKKDSADNVSLKRNQEFFGILRFNGYSFGKVPYFNLLIGDKSIPAKIDLGYREMIALPSHLIKDIAEKELIERIRVYDMNGKIHENNLYKVKNIRIQKMSLIHASVEEISSGDMHDLVLSGMTSPEEDQFGIIGYNFFSIMNLLIDCKYHSLALCDSLETLKKQGYPVDSFSEVSMLDCEDYIAFEAITEAGPLCCMLDTGSTFNFLNKDLENGCNDHRILTSDSDPSLLNPENKNLLVYDQEGIQVLSRFNIGGKEFGPLTLHRIKCPLDVDVILGMEFFNSNLLFIDFENKKVYFSPYQT